MYTNSKVAKSIRLALMFGGASMALSGAASAQDTSDEAQVEEAQERISVTGSRIKRTDLETASPISVFTSEDLEASGYTTVEKFVHSLPAVSGAAQGSNVNNGSNGSATVSLRGLGSGRTLLLVNGRRTAFSDMNSIPMSFIERIEVLRDGASTIYGSDAIAGVINFITKRDFEGAEFVAQYDLTGEGDGETTKVAATVGTSSDRGNVVLSLEYTNRNQIWQGDREFAACPLFDDGDGGVFCGGSGTTAMGTWSTESGSYKGYVVDPETGNIRPFNNATDGYNYAAVSYMVTPMEVFSINGAASYDLTADTTVFLEGGFTNRQSDQLMGPEGTFWGQFVPGTHPNNPVGEDLFINRRLTESGGRAFTQDLNDYRMVVGFEGFLDNGWTWDVSYNYTRFVDTRVDFGRANEARFLTLTDQAACDADAACPGLWNPFVPDSLTQAQLDYAFIPNSPVVRGQTKQFMANISGDLFGFGLPAGDIAWAAGVEKRWEDYLFQPDGAALIGQIYSVAGEKTEGQYDVTEAFIELDVPLLADMPGVEDLRLSAAVRSSNYSFLDSTTNTKLGLEYTPFEGLLIRATRADGFRAPSITELFAPRQESNLNYNEPCDNWASNPDANIQANCAAEGLPGNFQLASNQSASLVGGNPDLTPEESESLTVGFVYTPDFIENFSLAVDYFNIEITDGVGKIDTNTIVNGCYSSANFSSPLCDLILGAAEMGRPAYSAQAPNRDILGAVAGIVATNANLSSFETAGYDFDANWSTDFASGLLKLRLEGTYLDDYSFTSAPGAMPTQYAGFFAADQWEDSIAAFSKLRTNFTASYAMDNVSVAWTARYMQGTDDLNFDPADTSGYAGSAVYHDLQASYMLNDTTTISGGVRNLFDRLPPYTTNNDDMNTIATSYDLAGAYWYVRLGMKF